MISIQVIGNLGGDATYQAGAGGKSGRLNFSLAGQTGYGDNAKSLWFSCTKWGPASDGLMAALKKGARIAVSGRLGTYDTKEGEQRLSLDVFDLSFVQRPQGDEKLADKPIGKAAPKPKSDDVPFDDEIPF